MVEVLLETSIGQLSNDLYSSINWSKVGLKSFKEFKNSIFREFEERELRFNIQYEKVTPFANQQIEIEYINEVQFVGEEEEFNLDMFNLFDEENTSDDALSVENLKIEKSQVENLVLKTTEDGFDYYGVDLEDGEDEEDTFDNSVEEGVSEVSTPEEVVYVEEEKMKEEEELVNEPSSIIVLEKPTQDIPKVISPVKDDPFSSVDDLLNSVDESTIMGTKPVVSKRVPTKERPRTREITYHEGMSLRQFLRENPRSTMEVAEKYFTRRDIMKEIQLGRVIKRGQKLFI
jgi:hypothetical protein